MILGHLKQIQLHKQLLGARTLLGAPGTWPYYYYYYHHHHHHDYYDYDDDDYYYCYYITRYIKKLLGTKGILGARKLLV